MDAYRWLVYIHIASGAIALATFWTAAIARKGSPMHKAVGKIYLLAMLGILLTSLPMAAVFLAKGRTVFGVFFAYLVVITGTAVWLSWRAIQMKRDRASYFDTRYASVAWFNIVSGLIVFAIGLGVKNPLLMGFCWLGVLTGTGMLRKRKNVPNAANWWLIEHYGAMLGNGVATHVAFIGVGMRSVFGGLDPMWQLFPWFAPILVAVVAGVYLDRRYGNKSAARAKPVLTPAA